MFMNSRYLAVIALVSWAFAPLGADEGSLPELMPERITEIAGWLGPQPVYFTPPFADRAYWQAVEQRYPVGDLPGVAEQKAAVPPPELTDELFSEFKRTGSRKSYERPYAERMRRLGLFTFAEGFRNDGHFMGAIEREIRAILSEPSWALPAHTISFANREAAREFVDLGASERAWNLATVDYLLGEKLPSEVRKQIRKEVKARVLSPYLERVAACNRWDYWWMNNGNNWNAVCNAGVLGSALLLECDGSSQSRLERARYIAAFETYTRPYLAGFGDDGFCREGLGYWGYGYGNFVLAADLIRRTTEGRVDLLAGQKQSKIATFDVRWKMVADSYPTFGDVPVAVRPPAWLHDFATLRYGGGGRLFGMSGGSALVPEFGLSLQLTVPLFALALPRPATLSEGDQLALRDWFPNGGALIVRCRPAESGLVAALKGGVNDNSHHHNDLGAFMVACDGDIVLSDLGSDSYVRETFGKQRFTSGVINSFGHAVPRVAGQLQRSGSQARAVVVRMETGDEEDVLELDLTSAYEAEGLQRLTRTFVFSRAKGGQLSIIDHVAFQKGRKESFGTALILRPKQGREAVSNTSFCVRGKTSAVKVAWEAEADGQPTSLSLKEESILGIVPSQGPKGMRVGLEFPAPVNDAVIKTIITPERQGLAKTSQP